MLACGTPHFDNVYPISEKNMSRSCRKALASTSSIRCGTTLMKGDLRGIVKARRLSHLTMNNIRENLFFAFFYNAPGCSAGGRRSLPCIWPASEPDDRRRCHELQLGFGDC
jgi:hypothetical protein